MYMKQTVMSIDLFNGDQWVVYLSTAFGIQILGYLLSVFVLQSEVCFDLFGSITFCLVALESYNSNSLPSQIATLLVIIWACRLGSFLFFRVLKTGGDSRFEKIRSDRIAFFVAWMMQGVWVTVTLLPLCVVTTGDVVRQWQIVAGVGVWCLGFLMECVADAQKFAFKLRPENAGRIIRVGVWNWCKYPNYLGEIILWCGVCITCTSSLDDIVSSWDILALSLLSPIFVTTLLCFVSGIPIQERQARARWGEAWENDDRNILIPSWSRICMWNTRELGGSLQN